MQSLSGMSSFDRFLLGDSRRRSADICAFNVYGEGYTDTDMFISLDGNPGSGKLATSEKITSIELTSAHIIER